MGIFSSIKKAGKKFLNGIKKVFSKAGDVVRRIADSDWGKILLYSAAVFVGGMAISGAVDGWSEAASANESFMGKFVSGAKGFVTGLTSPIDQANKLISGNAPASKDPYAMAANASPVDAAVDVIETQAVTAPGNLEEAAMMAEPDTAAAAAGRPGGGMTPYGQESGMLEASRQATEAPKQTGDVSAKTPEAGGEKNWLEKAASYALNFMESPVGAQLLQGYAEGGADEEQNKFDDRVRQSWMDPNNALARLRREGMTGNFEVTRGKIPSFLPGGGSSLSQAASLGG